MARGIFRWLGFGALAVIGFNVASGAEAAVAIYGQLGYQIVEFEQDQDGGGVELAGALHYDFDRWPGGATPFAEGGLRYGNAKATEDGVTSKLAIFSLGITGGMQVAVAQKMSLQAALGYDFGMSGDFTVDTGGTSKEYDVNDYRRLNHEWRALFNVYPTTRIGFGLGWFTGNFKPSSFDKDVDFSGYALRALLDSRF